MKLLFLGVLSYFVMKFVIWHHQKKSLKQCKIKLLPTVKNVRKLLHQKQKKLRKSILHKDKKNPWFVFQKAKKNQHLTWQKHKKYQLFVKQKHKQRKSCWMQKQKQTQSKQLQTHCWLKVDMMQWIYKLLKNISKHILILQKKAPQLLHQTIR